MLYSLQVLTAAVTLRQVSSNIYIAPTYTSFLPSLLTYLLTPWCRVPLEKLTGLQLVKKFPAFHGTRRFITALTSVRHLSLSWASPIQSIYPHPTSWRTILILSTHLRLGLPSGLMHYIKAAILLHLKTPIMPNCPGFPGIPLYCHVVLQDVTCGRRVPMTNGHVTDDVDHLVSLGVVKIPFWTVASCATHTSEHMTQNC